MTFTPDDSSLSSDQNIEGTRWRPLQSGFVKVNFDGAVFDNSNLSGVGAVIRNHSVAVMASCAEKLNQAYKADEIEALAALKALQFVYDLSFQNAILEGDLLGLIFGVSQEKYDYLGLRCYISCKQPHFSEL